MTAAATPTGRRVRLGRAAALATSVLSGLAAVAVVVIGTDGGGRFDHFLQDYISHIAVIAIAFGLLSWVVLPRQWGNRVVWVYLLVAVLAGVYVLSNAVAFAGMRAGGFAIGLEQIDELRPIDLGPVSAWGVFLSDVAVTPAIWGLLSLGVLLFPNGGLPSPRWRWVAWLAVASMLATSVILGYLERPGGDLRYGALDTYDDIIVWPLLGLVVATGFSFISLLVRFRRSTGAERQQIRWVLFGSALSVPALGVAVMFDGVDQNALAVIVLIGLTIYSAGFWLAITRYHLYDIDVVISRSIVFAVLAAFITGVYAIVVAGVGSWIGAGSSNLGLSIAATALVAVVFEPVRLRIQRFANRVVFGTRATPYQVLSDLTARLASAESTEGLLERMVQRLTEGTGASRAVLRLDGASPTIWPPEGADTAEDDEFTLPITAGETIVGSVSVLKGRDESLTPTERGLVEDLAGSAGMVLNKMRLDADLATRAEELRVSRRRLVDAQAEERRRLERDLHDGAQQQVVALKVKLGLAQRFAEQEGSGRAAELIQEMAADAQAAIDEIRSLGKGIFPPLLASDGLRAALSAGAANAPIPILVDTGDLGRYPREVEAAVYFCVSEAITNAIKYSEAGRIEVQLTGGDRRLDFVVADDGRGFDPISSAKGSGLVGMRDRLEAVGGSLAVTSSPGRGTRVAGSIPATAA